MDLADQFVIAYESLSHPDPEVRSRNNAFLLALYEKAEAWKVAESLIKACDQTRRCMGSILLYQKARRQLNRLSAEQKLNLRDFILSSLEDRGQSKIMLEKNCSSLALLGISMIQVEWKNFIQDILQLMKNSQIHLKAGLLILQAVGQERLCANQDSRKTQRSLYIIRQKQGYVQWTLNQVLILNNQQLNLLVARVLKEWCSLGIKLLNSQLFNAITAVAGLRQQDQLLSQLFFQAIRNSGSLSEEQLQKGTTLSSLEESRLMTILQFTQVRIRQNQQAVSWVGLLTDFVLKCSDLFQKYYWRAGQSLMGCLLNVASSHFRRRDKGSLDFWISFVNLVQNLRSKDLQVRMCEYLFQLFINCIQSCLMNGNQVLINQFRQSSTELIERIIYALSQYGDKQKLNALYQQLYGLLTAEHQQSKELFFWIFSNLIYVSTHPPSIQICRNSIKELQHILEYNETTMRKALFYIQNFRSILKHMPQQFLGLLEIVLNCVPIMHLESSNAFYSLIACFDKTPTTPQQFAILAQRVFQLLTPILKTGEGALTVDNLFNGLFHLAQKSKDIQCMMLILNTAKKIIFEEDVILRLTMGKVVTGAIEMTTDQWRKKFQLLFKQFVQECLPGLLFTRLQSDEPNLLLLSRVSTVNAIKILGESLNVQIVHELIIKILQWFKLNPKEKAQYLRVLILLINQSKHQILGLWVDSQMPALIQFMLPYINLKCQVVSLLFSELIKTAILAWPSKTQNHNIKAYIEMTCWIIRQVKLFNSQKLGLNLLQVLLNQRTQQAILLNVAGFLLNIFPSLSNTLYYLVVQALIRIKKLTSQVIFFCGVDKAVETIDFSRFLHMHREIVKKGLKLFLGQEQTHSLKVVMTSLSLFLNEMSDQSIFLQIQMIIKQREKKGRKTQQLMQL